MDVTRSKIREARCRNADGRWFVPEGSLVSALPPEVIGQSLENHCNVEPFAVQWMIQAIEKGGRKTFATLILIREEKKIIAFLEHYLQSDSQKLDSRLPFSKSELGTILSPDMASEFHEHQWEPIAPVFTHRLLHRNIPIEFTLPFIKSRRIGGGGFGDVYEVVITAGHHNFKDIDTTKPARLVRKELRKGFGADDLWAEVGFNEHQIMSYLYHLEHPNILPLLTSYTYNGVPNFLLPLAEGGDLEHLMNEKTRPSELSQDAQFYDAISGLASGLETLHEYKSDVLGREMIGYHHDLKPKNVLVSTGRFILSDFGLSKLKIGETSRTPFKKGQGHYLAPECEDPEHDFSKGMINRASDTWSLGCILLEVIIYMAGGSDSVARFRESRTTKKGFLTTRTFFHEDSINPGVEKMLIELAECGDIAIEQSVALIRQILVINPENRLKASGIAVGFRLISFEAWYLNLSTAFDAIRWRVEDPETIAEWNRLRQLAHSLTSRDNTMAICTPSTTSSNFFSKRSQVESLLESIKRLFNYIVTLDLSADFTTAISSDLKQVNSFLDLKLTDNQRKCDSTSLAEAESVNPTTTTVEPEQMRELSWKKSTLTVPTANVNNATISKDERFLAVEYNRQISIYALPSGDIIQAMRIPDALQPAQREWYGRYPQFAFTPDGKNLIVCWTRYVCSYKVDGNGSEFSILFPPLTEVNNYRNRGRSESMMMPIITGLAAISADSRCVAFGVTRRRSTLSDAFEELIIIVYLTRNGEVDGPPSPFIVGDDDCVAEFSPDNRQLAVGSQKLVRHHRQNAIRIRLLDVFGSGTDQEPMRWFTIYCNEKLDKGPRRPWIELFDVMISHPRLAFAVWESRWVVALWEKSKRTLTLHDLHSQSQLLSFKLVRHDISGPDFGKTVFSADLKVTASLIIPARNVLVKFGLGKERSTDNELAIINMKTKQKICTLKGGYFDKYWLSNSGQYIVTRKKGELRVFRLLES